MRLAAQAEAKREVERMAGPVMDRKQGQPKAVTGASATRVGAVASDEMGRQAADGKVPDLSSMNASEPGTAAPISRHALPVLTQQRKADYFEAYLGALFLSSGYASVTGWLEPLLEPWLERAARDWRFKSGEQFKTAAAKMRARDAVERDRLEEEKRKEILKGELNELGPIRRVARWVTKSVVGWVWPEVKLVESNRSSGQCTREKRN